MDSQYETLEQIADRIAPNGGKQAAMQAAKMKARQKVYIATRPQAEPTEEQQAALSAYIAAREERDGLRDDLTFGDIAEQNNAVAKLAEANSALGKAITEATRLGVIEAGRRLFR